MDYLLGYHAFLWFFTLFSVLLLGLGGFLNLLFLLRADILLLLLGQQLLQLLLPKLVQLLGRRPAVGLVLGP